MDPLLTIGGLVTAVSAMAGFTAWLVKALQSQSEKRIADIQEQLKDVIAQRDRLLDLALENAAIAREATAKAVRKASPTVAGVGAGRIPK